MVVDNTVSSQFILIDCLGLIVQIHSQYIQQLIFLTILCSVLAQLQ